MTLNPKSVVPLVAAVDDDVQVLEDDSPLLGQLRNVFRRVGLRYPDRVTVAVTDGRGPTSLGSDSRRGALMLLPYELVALWDPECYVSFEGVYEGPVGAMSAEQRKFLLTERAILIPTAGQIEFVIGHEAAHLKHRHTLETTKVASLVALMTHFSLKVHNNLAHRWVPQIPGLVIRSTFVYSALIASVTAMVVFALSWDQELQADATAARELNLTEEAVQLKQNQLEQNRSLRDHGVRFIDKTGNDYRDLEHPPTALQLFNLQKLKESIKKDPKKMKNKD